MIKTYKIYIDTLTECLDELSSADFQKRIWTNQDNPQSLVASFSEAIIGVFDDALVAEALENDQVIFDMAVTQVLRQLDVAVDAVDDARPVEEFIASSAMDNVRQKAAEALHLIEMSDGSENTVRLIKRGES